MPRGSRQGRSHTHLFTSGLPNTKSQIQDARIKGKKKIKITINFPAPQCPHASRHTGAFVTTPPRTHRCHGNTKSHRETLSPPATRAKLPKPEQRGVRAPSPVSANGLAILQTAVLTGNQSQCQGCQLQEFTLAVSWGDPLRKINRLD